MATRGIPTLLGRNVNSGLSRGWAVRYNASGELIHDHEDLSRMTCPEVNHDHSRNVPTPNCCGIEKITCRYRSNGDVL